MTQINLPTPSQLNVEPVIPPRLRPAPIAPLSPADSARLFTLGGKPSLREYLRQMWQFREFAALSPMAQLRSKSTDTVLGQIWNLLNPLLLIAVYFLVFQVILGIESRRGVDNYLPFLTVGILTYNFLRTSTQGGARSILKGRGLMHSLHFPRALLPISSTTTQFLSHLWAVATMAVLLPFMGVRPHVGLALFPVVLLMQTMMNAGLAFFAARFTFHFRDFEKFLSYLLRLGMYLSGVLIPINDQLISNDVILWTVRLTPSFAIVDVARQSLLNTDFLLSSWIVSAVWSTGLLVGGMAYFRAEEQEYSHV